MSASGAPTRRAHRHLDLPTVERLEEALAAYPGALLLVTHDDAFAARCTSSTWRLVSGRVER
jgi:ATPase subunit of ABC transporter with duplicated ATPase domains